MQIIKIVITFEALKVAFIFYIFVNRSSSDLQQNLSCLLHFCLKENVLTAKTIHLNSETIDVI